MARPGAISDEVRPEGAWRRWAERPQRLWIRRALFQVHLWVGIGIGLYVLLISLSGSAVVYRRELNRKYGFRPLVAVQPTGKISTEELKKRAQTAFPQFHVIDAYGSRRANALSTVIFEQGSRHFGRFFDPYTGSDLGPNESHIQRSVEFATDLHDNLLMGETGRTINGIGAMLVTVLALTGLFIWWPGTKNWQRSLTIKWDARFARFNWDSHSAVGFWSSLFILIWGISGIYFSFPNPFIAVFGDTTLLWLSRLHFGRMGWFAEIVWTIFGLAPALLFVTGVLVWWNRKLRKRPDSTGHT